MAEGAVRRTLFRSFARLSNGTRMEVFPWPALRSVAAACSTTPLNMLSKSCSERSSISLLRHAFDAPTELDSLEVMRDTASLAHALRPATIPTVLPAIIEKRCLLPGERCRFVFFDAARHEIARRAVSADGDRRFVHLRERDARSSSDEDVRAASAGHDAVGTIVTITSASTLPYGRLVVECVVGPRCRIASYAGLDVTEGSRTASTQADGTARLLQVNPVLCADDTPDVPVCAANAEGAEEDARRRAWVVEELRSELAARLLHPANAGALAFCAMVPPLLCAERLSFFLCAMLLYGDDCERRLAALHSTSTLARLEFCQAAMDSADWAKKAAAEQTAIGAEVDAGVGIGEHGMEERAVDVGQALLRPWERVAEEHAGWHDGEREPASKESASQLPSSSTEPSTAKLLQLTARYVDYADLRKRAHPQAPESPQGHRFSKASREMAATGSRVGQKQR